MLVLERKDDGLLTSRGYGMAGDEFAPIKRTDELVQQFLFYPTSGDVKKEKGRNLLFFQKFLSG